MDLQTILMLAGAGLFGGLISALVGGAGIITFPAMLATGLNPVIATASNTAALMPGNLLAALSDRSQLPRLDRSFVVLVLSSLLAAGVGASLLLLTSERVFRVLVPLLLGSSTVLFAYSGRINAWVRARAASRATAAPRVNGATLAALAPVSVYGGYFGIGVGVLLLGVLSIGSGADYRAANVTKNLVTSLNGVVSSGVFIVQGAVVWPPTLAMMAGAIVGSLAGGLLARVMPNSVARVLVTVVGTLLTAVFAWRYWF